MHRTFPRAATAFSKGMWKYRKVYILGKPVYLVFLSITRPKTKQLVSFKERESQKQTVSGSESCHLSGHTLCSRMLRDKSVFPDPELLLLLLSTVAWFLREGLQLQTAELRSAGTEVSDWPGSENRSPCCSVGRDQGQTLRLNVKSQLATHRLWFTAAKYCCLQQLAKNSTPAATASLVISLEGKWKDRKVRCSADDRAFAFVFCFKMNHHFLQKVFLTDG